MLFPGKCGGWGFLDRAYGAPTGFPTRVWSGLVHFHKVKTDRLLFVPAQAIADAIEIVGAFSPNLPLPIPSVLVEP